MEIWGQFSVVFAVLSALLGLLWWARRAGWASLANAGARTSSRDKAMRVLERVTVSAHHSLLLVEINGAQMLVCLSPGGSSVTRLDRDQR